MDNQKMIVYFGYDGENTSITDLAMDVRLDASPLELLCAGMMFQRFAVGKFTKIALENGETQKDIDDIVRKLFENMGGLHGSPTSVGEAQ